MWLFLQIVLAVILVLLGVALLAWWYFRRWLRRTVGKAQAGAAIVGNDYARSARLRLDPVDTADSATPAFQSVWESLRALGCTPLGDWVDSQESYEYLRFGLMPGAQVAAVVNERDGKICFTWWALTRSNQLYALGNGPDPEWNGASMRWRVNPASTPAQALAELQAQLEGLELREQTLSVAKAAYEAAHAARMDAALARGPTRADIEALASQRSPGASAETIDGALEMARQLWSQQLELALLDRYRRASKLDAVSWERLGGDIHVIHDQLNPTEIRALLMLEASQMAAADEIVAAGTRGPALYERLQQLLPPAQRRRCLGTVDRPLSAQLYVRDTEHAAIATPQRAYTYEATDDDGRTQYGAVMASGSADAKRRAAAKGLSEVRIMSEPVGSPDAPVDLTDPNLAQIAVRSLREGIGLSLLRAIWGNVWLWAPPLALLANSLYDGAPFGGGDYAVFAYAGLALLLLVGIVGPMFWYNRLLQARVLDDASSALRYAWMLRKINLLGVPPRWQISGEECKIRAAKGELDEALAAWDTFKGSITPEQHLSMQMQIYDAAGEHDQMIANQRQLVDLAVAKELVTVDLAMGLARYQDKIDEAEDLLARVPMAGLSEVGLIGFHFTRGLINSGRGQYGLAAGQFQQAIARAQPFRSNPLVQGIIMQIHGFLAWALQGAGQGPQAAALWQIVGPELERQRGARDIVARYRRLAQPAA